MSERKFIVFTGTTGSGKSTTGIETLLTVADQLKLHVEPIDEYKILREGWAMKNRGKEQKVEWKQADNGSEYFIIQDAAYQEAFLAVASAIANIIINSDADGWVTEAARKIGIPLAGYYSHLYQPLAEKLPFNIKFVNIEMEVSTLSEQASRVENRLIKHPDAAPVGVLKKYLKFANDGESSVEAASRLGTRVIYNSTFDNSGSQNETITRMKGILDQILAGGVPV